MALFPNGTQFRRGRGYGTSAFITHKRLTSREFIKGDDAYILLTVEGIEKIVVLCELAPCCGHWLSAMSFWVLFLDML